jgi:4,5-DOPA dioxygenase extradiol
MSCLFVSHGPPAIVRMNVPAVAFLKKLAGTLPVPKAIVCFSAHWETVEPKISAAARPEIIYDFSGPAPLFDLAYPIEGDPELADRMVTLLASKSLPGVGDPPRGAFI